MAGYKHLEIPGNFERFVKDKKQSANAYYRYFLTRLTRMFEYKGLPDTIPHQILDRYLFINGIALITEVEGKLYCFYGNAGGEQDVYYRPSKFIVSNPHLKSHGELFTANVPIFPTCHDDEVGRPTSESGEPSSDFKGVLIRNDTEWQGLNPLLSRYSYLLAENTLTLRTADVMLRITSLLTAPSDKERLAALEYLKTIENGNLGVIGESAFFDGVKLQSPPSNNGSYLTQFIEYQQYLKGSFFNELGLAANYNMKREAIGRGESSLDSDALLPLCDDMLLCRRQDLQRVNETFGTSIEVSLSSAWLENEIERYAELQTLVGSGNGSTQSVVPFGATDSTPPASTEGPISGEPDGSTQVDGNGGSDEKVEPVEERKPAVPVEPIEETKPAEPVEDVEPEGDDGSTQGNEDSKINDMTWSKDLHELEDKIFDEPEESAGVDGAMRDGLTQADGAKEGDDEDGLDDEKETSDN